MKLSKKEFLKHRRQFGLGHLTTESFHPLSKDLSDIVKEDIEQAIEVLTQIDTQALTLLKDKYFEVFKLQQQVQAVLKEGHKVFLCGCGATGRLALSLERLYRDFFQSSQVCAFMAGGDYALIKSVESFEDSFEYGKRQLKELGFSKNDLLISITEGGETSFVIGAAEFAADYSQEPPFFLYCNPDSELSSINRSQRVLKNNKIKKINLSVGPMAISGSTRMQATTVQMIATGFSLFYQHVNIEAFQKAFVQFIELLEHSSFHFIKDFIRHEYEVYQKNEIVTYRSDEKIAMAILTDTTERSPTFNLVGFERDKTDEPSLVYLAVKDEQDPLKAWQRLLGRKPRCLDWQIPERISLKDLYQFDISEKTILRRNEIRENHVFDIYLENGFLLFMFGDLQRRIKIPQEADLFFIHLYLKLILNIHSTLLMGLLERYQGNMMTYVSPSNFKLIDRCFRYTKEILKGQSIHISDDDLIDEIFKRVAIKKNSIVLDVLNSVKSQER